MQKLICYEMIKFFNAIMIGSVLALFILNGFCMYYYIQFVDAKGYTIAQKQAAYESMGGEQEESLVYEDIDKEIREINQFYSVRNSIMKSDSTIDSFLQNKSSYEEKRIQKVQEIYSKLQKTKIQVDCSEGVLALTDSGIIDIFCMVAIFLLLIREISYEWENGYYKLFLTISEGRIVQLKVKMIFVGILFLLFYITLFAIEFFVIDGTIGFGDFNRSIQSIAGYTLCPYMLSVKQYILLFSVTKFVAWVILLMCFFGCFAIFKKMFRSILSCIGAIAISFYLWNSVSTYSWISCIHFLNLYSILNISEYYKSYESINIVGIPTNVILCISFFSICCLFFLWRLVKRYGFEIGSECSKVISFSRKGNRNRVHGLWYYEIYKQVVMNKGFIFSIFVILLCSQIGRDQQMYQDLAATYYEGYMEILEGDLSNEKQRYIKDELESIDNFYANADEQQKIVLDNRKIAIQWIQTQYKELLERQKNGYEIAIVSQVAWERLLGKENRKKEVFLAGIFYLWLILMQYQSFSMEDDTYMTEINLTVHNGKQRLKWQKVVVCSCMAAVMVLICFGINYMQIYYLQGLTGEEYSIASIVARQPIQRSIKESIFICWISRFGSAIISAWIVNLSSIKIRNTAVRITLLVMLFLMPVLLYLLGLTGEIVLLPFMTGHMWFGGMCT